MDMDLVFFLEQLAGNTHNCHNFKELLLSQADLTQCAFTTNNSDLIKKQFQGSTYYADKTGVVQA